MDLADLESSYFLSSLPVGPYHKRAAPAEEEDEWTARSPPPLRRQRCAHEPESAYTFSPQRPVIAPYEAQVVNGYVLGRSPRNQRTGVMGTAWRCGFQVHVSIRYQRLPELAASTSPTEETGVRVAPVRADQYVPGEVDMLQRCISDEVHHCMYELGTHVAHEAMQEIPNWVSTRMETWVLKHARDYLELQHIALYLVGVSADVRKMEFKPLNPPV